MERDSFWTNIFRRSDKGNFRLRDFLKSVFIFSDLAPREIIEVEKITHQRYYKPGERLFCQGDPGVGMYVLLKGEISITRYSENGERKLIASLVPGDFFGEMALSHDSKRTAYAYAETKSEVLSFFKEDINELIETKPKIGIKFLRKLSLTLAERLWSTYQDYEKLIMEVSAKEEKDDKTDG